MAAYAGLAFSIVLLRLALSLDQDRLARFRSPRVRPCARGRRGGSDALVSIPLAPMLSMGALSVFNTALAYYAYFRLVNEEGATLASLNNYIVPLIGVIAGALALAEPVTSSAWAELALVLCGVFLTGRSLGRANAPRPASAASRARA
jgi:EamA-like transporter family